MAKEEGIEDTPDSGWEETISTALREMVGPLMHEVSNSSFVTVESAAVASQAVKRTFGTTVWMVATSRVTDGDNQKGHPMAPASAHVTVLLREGETKARRTA